MFVQQCQVWMRSVAQERPDERANRKRAKHRGGLVLAHPLFTQLQCKMRLTEGIGIIERGIIKRGVLRSTERGVGAR